MSSNLEKNFQKIFLTTRWRYFLCFSQKNSCQILLDGPLLLFWSSLCRWDLCEHFDTEFSFRSIPRHVISTLWKCLLHLEIGKFSEKFSEKTQNFLKIISFGLLGSFFIILFTFRPFDINLEQNKFIKAEKIKIFMRNFSPLGVDKVKFR